ncbi:ABC transporter substrate-binding protein [Mesorhizobium kowhaii]|uniref:Solute-binding protein family 5 domain-containing protein n=1 Tax=Mesorhizobium kowhaii TaxID=1300272 RepID=A0A2W7C3K2_9HYPH|nr:ABC transporter substrate-binding protein [Mesorhizobium kowhaii]PZV36388.1 hypothetical protein B5V02_21640 [Mesorhizobium kowhaii]
MRMSKHLRAILILTTALLPGESSAGQDLRETDVLTLAIGGDISSSDPGVDRDSTSDTVLHHVIEGLVAYKEDLTVGPMLAKSWEISADGRTYTFKLRDSLKFHNGDAVTSADVAWSWSRYLDPKTKWQCTYRFDGSFGSKVEQITTPDRVTVQFQLSEPDALFLANMANIQCLTAVLSKASLKADGSWDKPIGTGPYMFGKWEHNRYITLERFADYQSLPGERDGLAGGKHAYAKQLKFLVVPDASARKSALYTGEIDVVSDFGAADIEDAKARNTSVSVQSSMAWQMLLLQTEDPILADLRVRRAIAHALDIQQIANAATYGLATPNPSAVPTMSPYYGDKQTIWPAYDPAAAAALLKEAGYSGQKLSIQTNKKFENMYSAAVVIQSMLQAVGINAELEVLDFAAQLDNYYSGKFQLMSFGMSARLDPAYSFETFMGAKKDDASNQWEDPDALMLLAAAKSESDPSKRQAIFDSLHARLAEQVPIIGLFNDPLVTAIGPKVRGYADWPAGKERLWGVWRER